MATPKINAELLSSIDLIKFNNLISAIKALGVKSVDFHDSVLSYESDDMHIESDLKDFFGILVNGKFPLDDAGLGDLTNVILTGKGSVNILEDGNDNIVIRKEFSDDEYRLAPTTFHTMPSAIKKAPVISNVISAKADDIKIFQDLSKPKYRFVLLDGKQFCITGKGNTILDQGCAKTFGSSYSFQNFIPYKAKEANFRVKDNNGELWLHAKYLQNEIPVNAYLKLTKEPFKPSTKPLPTLSKQGLTQVGYITPNNFDILYKVLKFYKSFKSVSIFQNELFATGKVLAYADFTDLFSIPVNFKIPEPTKFQKECSMLDDNAGSSVRFDLKVRNDILIAENQNQIFFIHVPPGKKIKRTLSDYLSAEYSFKPFDKINNRPKQFDDVDVSIQVNSERIDKNHRAGILAPAYFELTNKKYQEFCKSDPIEFPLDDMGESEDGLEKPPEDQFFSELADSVKGMVGNLYSDSDQFNKAFDDATRGLISAIEPDENSKAIHVRKRDLRIREKGENRFPIITQKDIDRYRTLIAGFARVEEKNPTMQIFVKGNDVNLCNLQGKADHFHYFAGHQWDSLYEPKHFLSLEADWYEFTIDCRYDDWLVTKHQFKQRDILTFEKIVKKAEQKNRQQTRIDPKCVVPSVKTLKSRDILRQEIITDYENYLDYRFKMLEKFCYLIKNKQHYFKDQKDMMKFFIDLGNDLKLAQSTIYADKKIAEMLVALDRENLLKKPEKGWSYKLMKISNAYDDKTKVELLSRIGTMNRDEVDKFVSESRPQAIKEKPENSKIRGMKIRRNNKQIVISFEKRGTESDADVEEKLSKLYKQIRYLENID